MGSSQLPEILEHWVTIIWLVVAASWILVGLALVVDSYFPRS